ncbi:MAG: hypothetical protein Q8O19_02695 [Rectinemataceae bacterium]|nr:hypothetical protein [Rectinemataceae bacterium]
MKTARSQFSILKQICEFIPRHLAAKLAREHGVEDFKHLVERSYVELP